MILSFLLRTHPSRPMTIRLMAFPIFIPTKLSRCTLIGHWPSRSNATRDSIRESLHHPKDSDESESKRITYHDVTCRIKRRRDRVNQAPPSSGKGHEKALKCRTGNGRANHIVRNKCGPPFPLRVLPPRVVPSIRSLATATTS